MKKVFIIISRILFVAGNPLVELKSFDELEHNGVLISSEDFEKSEQRWDNEWHRHIIEQAVQIIRPDVSPATYEAFCMAVLQGIQGNIVADKLGISLESVYVAKHRFIKRLKPLLKRLEEENS